MIITLENGAGETAHTTTIPDREDGVPYEVILWGNRVYMLVSSIDEDDAIYRHATGYRLAQQLTEGEGDNVPDVPDIPDLPDLPRL